MMPSVVSNDPKVNPVILLSAGGPAVPYVVDGVRVALSSTELEVEVAEPGLRASLGTPDLRVSLGEGVYIEVADGSVFEPDVFDDDVFASEDVFEDDVFEDDTFEEGGGTVTVYVGSLTVALESEDVSVAISDELTVEVDC